MSSDAPSEETGQIKKLHVFRRIYEWTIAWADRPRGAWALFFIALAESSFFPIPPDILLLALCVGAPTKAFRFALICTTGSIVGGVIGYGIGYWGYELIGEPIVRAYHGEAVMEQMKAWHDEYGFMSNMTAAITPIPYKVFTIASGTFEFSFSSFLISSIIGRSLRFFIVAGLLYYFGAKMKVLIEKYFDWLAILFMILLIGGFVLLKFLK